MVDEGVQVSVQNSLTKQQTNSMFKKKLEAIVDEKADKISELIEKLMQK